MNENEIANTLLKDYPINMQPKDVAKFLGISVSTVYGLIKQSDFPAMTMPGGRIHLIPKHKFLVWYCQQIDNKQAVKPVE